MKNETTIKAIKKGNFKDVFGVDIDCYILDDKNKTAVINKKKMAQALNLKSEGGGAFNRFISGKIINEYIDSDLRKKLDNPLKFKAPTSDSGFVLSLGYDVSILIDLCNVILKAKTDNKLTPAQQDIAIQAQIIVNASAKLGIRNLAYALAGYQPQIQEIIDNFKNFLVEEVAREYRKTFPVELYQEWSKIYNFDLKIGKNFNVMCRWLTIKHVYQPLLRSNGRIYEMLKKKKAEDLKGNQRRLFQYLNDKAGEPALKKHLTQLLTIAQLADGDKTRYENDFTKLFGGQLQFDFNLLKS